MCTKRGTYHKSDIYTYTTAEITCWSSNMNSTLASLK